jgi:hypothetical protein
MEPDTAPRTVLYWMYLINSPGANTKDDGINVTTDYNIFNYIYALRWQYCLVGDCQGLT